MTHSERPDRHATGRRDPTQADNPGDRLSLISLLVILAITNAWFLTQMVIYQ